MIGLTLIDIVLLQMGIDQMTSHGSVLLPFLFFFKREREGEGEHEQGAQGEREADSPQSREPDVGLDPRTLRL